MLSKVKTQLSIKRLLILLGALFLSISIGSGAKSAFAGQGIQSLLTSWFDDNKTESINQIEAAITAEKERLMVDLKVSLKEEMQAAQAALDTFTNDEKQKRITELQQHAKDLKATIKFDNSEKNREVNKDLDAVYEEAIKQMNEISRSAKAQSAPKTQSKPKQEPRIETETNPKPKTEPKAEAEIITEPIPETPADESNELDANSENNDDSDE